MTDHIEALKIILAKDYGVVKFFKTFEYPSYQRDLAEEDLRQALEGVISEEDQLSSKAQQWLLDFDKMIHSLNVKRYWNSIQASEEREITRIMKVIFSEKEEQHVYRVKKNIVAQRDLASDSLRINIQEHLGKRLSSLHTPYSNKKIKSSGQTEIDEDHSIDAVYGNHDIPSRDHTTTETKQEKIIDETSPIDLKSFEEAYSALDPNCMWTLESGRRVEEVIYQYARNLSGESCLHSFIINDADLNAKSLFTNNEWEEITTSEVKIFQNLKLHL
ncbi:4220_t:CDS:2 [Funneliformis geosporum]|uniref:19439_t:CDS:1 n=1 Tax=Funneliformis geosporum TaxID=1117311 RepID=A0A9W4X2Z5_9GLOM|nr:4220_t:CDS:2 [Funneliformis geosporum]CAI2191364.1 19439_t:CDS:2 [Funneliformis geosporum]